MVATARPRVRERAFALEIPDKSAMETQEMMASYGFMPDTSWYETEGEALEIPCCIKPCEFLRDAQ